MKSLLDRERFIKELERGLYAVFQRDYEQYPYFAELFGVKEQSGDMQYHYVVSFKDFSHEYLAKVVRTALGLDKDYSVSSLLIGYKTDREITHLFPVIGGDIL